MSQATLLGQRVIDLVEGRLVVEHGTGDVEGEERVAIVAHWSRRARTTRSVDELLHQLQAGGYRVVLVSSAEVDGPLRWGPSVDPERLTVLRKPNVGYDFGSWAAALHAVPGLRNAPDVIIANDSMAGPFTSLQPLLLSFGSSPADVWGLTDSHQFRPHLQSYFLGFRRGVLAERPMVEFWSGIRHEADKSRIIFENEIGLSRLLHDEAYVRLPAFPHERVVAAGQNPVIIGWRKLLDLGFPFVKREILRDPAVAPSGATAPKVLARLFGVDVAEWIDEDES